MDILTSELRNHLRKINPGLAAKADNFWEISEPILERQNAPNSNENGLKHVKMVEHNCWRLINESNKINEFNPDEIYILSCSACCHDFDKGLLTETTDDRAHGEGSGDFLLANYKRLQQNIPEIIAIRKIIGIHDFSENKFTEELHKIEKTFSISTGTVKLHKLAVILKAADILHTDNSRISDLAIDVNKLKGIDRAKYLARESISGWSIDGTRIIASAVPQTSEALEAVEGCLEYIKSEEWPAVSDKLSDYNLPYNLSIHIDKAYLIKSECREISINDKELIIEKDGSDIPPIVVNWVGREKELVTLHSNFKVIFITGIGGQGKSAIAATFFNDMKLNKEYKYIDWRDFKEEDHKFKNKIASMISLVSNDSLNIGDLVGLQDEDLISIFFKNLENEKGLFVLDNVDSYIDLEKFEPSKGIGKLFKAAITKNHNSKFIFTCRPFIRYASVDFYQLALSGLSEENTIQFFTNSNISLRKEKILELATKAHKLTTGHPLWLSLIVAQAKRGESILTDFLNMLETHHIVDKNVSYILSETILREIWKSLNEKQKNLLRVLAESVRPETIDDFSEIASSELNYNAFYSSIRTLKNLNLIVEKQEGDFIELHPLVKEFVRTKYPQTDRTKYISLFIGYYNKIVLILKPKLSPKLSISEFANWINKIELHTNAKEFQKALDCIAEIKSHMKAAGYVEELLRVSKVLFNSLSWSKNQINNYNQFKSVFESITRGAVEFGDNDFAMYLVNQFASITETKEDSYILLCSLKGFINWFIGNNDKAIKIYREAEYLLSSGNQGDKYNIRHNLGLSLRDSKNPEYIEEALKSFLQNEDLVIISDSRTIDKDRSGNYYGNIGRCLQFKKEYSQSLNCYFKSFILLYLDNSSQKLINLGYASEWISDVLSKMHENESGLYFLKYAAEIWSNCSPPLSNKCKLKLSQVIQSSTVNSILSLERWQVENFCKLYIKKHSNIEYEGF